MDGLAEFILNERNYFVYDGDPADWPLLHEAFLWRGVAVRPSGRAAGECKLDPMDEKKSFVDVVATDAKLVGSFLFGSRHWRDTVGLLQLVRESR